MEFDKSYILPSIYSLGLHILMVVLLFFHFESKLDILKPQQRIVPSVAVEKSDMAKIDQQITNQQKSEKPKPKPLEDAIALEKPTNAPKPTTAPKPTVTPKPKPTAKPKPDSKKVNDLLAQAESELQAKKPAPPSELPPNAMDDPTTGAFDGDEDVARIKSKIESNWSRPANYQKGMKALLLVDLLPTGEVLNVEIKESSDDAGFDNSAEMAIRKSSPLPVPQDPQRFEKYFRKFNFLFCPDCTDNNHF